LTVWEKDGLRDDYNSLKFTVLLEQLTVLSDHKIGMVEFLGDQMPSCKQDVVGMLLNSPSPAAGIMDVHVMDEHLGRAAIPYFSVTGSGITFTPAEFLAHLAAIGAGGGLGGLMELLRVLYEQKTSTFAFLGGHILPLIYLPGAAPALFELILHCTNWTGVVNMDCLDQSIAINLGAIGPDNWLLTHYQAIARVGSFEAVDIETIDASDKYPHCSITWDEETDNNKAPVRLPCASGQHIIGFDCLVEILTAVGPPCPANIIMPSEEPHVGMLSSLYSN
jgi:hypothetical protein